ncbi:ethylbenzene dehydrogenase-related protein [Magnetospirillum sp. UT-4]|uniref:ethylbenzene dehydrogenase-related protein n=1 Tax=Magnetospirillum sp. UT-4 TaxID=2681467 RepID=UPI00137E09AF|nr:ethylbenzene dehydrogenase-related protein [Magnetospirillum sp. UT-4]CAA7624254.1 Cytochrome c-552 [Magnetospirillum sp. UT-4]
MSHRKAFLALGTACALVVAAAPAWAVDWAKAPEAKTILFYPGQSSFEWIQIGSDHGGARSFTKKGDKCSECHAEEAADMGKKMVSGQKIEPTVIAGKRAAIPLKIKAAYDATNLYMRFEFPAGPHNPAPNAAGGKMDPDNEIKLAMMIDDGKVGAADRSGCWASCHADARDMPSAPKKEALGAAKGIDTSAGYVTKYLPESRTAVSLKDEPRGGWDKLKSPADLDAMLKGGQFLDLVRFKSGKGGVSEDGYVLAERVLKQNAGATFQGKKEGDAWVVTMTRKLDSGQPGDVVLAAGKTYTVGVAVHDDHSWGRFHHVSLDLRLGLDAPGEIKAVKQ